jgi:hypothetical protein
MNTLPLHPAMSADRARPIIARRSCTLAVLTLLTALPNLGLAVETILRSCTFQGPRANRTTQWFRGPVCGTWTSVNVLFPNQSLNADNLADAYFVLSRNTGTGPKPISNVANPNVAGSNTSSRVMRVDLAAATCKTRTEVICYRRPVMSLNRGSKRVYRFQFHSDSNPLDNGHISQGNARSSSGEDVPYIQIKRAPGRKITVSFLFRDTDGGTPCVQFPNTPLDCPTFTLSGTYSDTAWNTFEMFVTHTDLANGTILFKLNGRESTYTGRTCVDNRRDAPQFKVGLYALRDANGNFGAADSIYFDNVSVSTF